MSLKRGEMMAQTRMTRIDERPLSVILRLRKPNFGKLRQPAMQLNDCDIQRIRDSALRIVKLASLLPEIEDDYQDGFLAAILNLFLDILRELRDATGEVFEDVLIYRPMSFAAAYKELLNYAYFILGVINDPYLDETEEPVFQQQAFESFVRAREATKALLSEIMEVIADDDSKPLAT